MVGALVLTGVPAAVAMALEAQHPTAPVTALSNASPRSTQATATPPAARRAATTLTGWRTTSTSVRPRQVLRTSVQVSGGRRVVRLERRLHDRWRVVDRAVTTTAGRATLTWRAPARTARAVLRVHVLRTVSDRALLSRHRAVVVRPAPKRAPSPTASTAPTASVAPTPTSAPTTAAPPATSAAERLRVELFTLVNEARATARTCGSETYPAAAPLARSAALDSAAGDYAARMATEDFFSHSAPDGSAMVSRLNAVGVRNTTMRENIAAGQRTAASVMASWLGSSGHCANLMSTDVTRIGLGHAVGSGSAYGDYWVQDFAG